MDIKGIKAVQLCSVLEHCWLKGTWHVQK